MPMTMASLTISQWVSIPQPVSHTMSAPVASTIGKAMCSSDAPRSNCSMVQLRRSSRWGSSGVRCQASQADFTYQV